MFNLTFHVSFFVSLFFFCGVAWQALRLDYLVQKVRPILTKLMSSGTGPQRGLFNVPVDPVKLGIPDYFRRVLHPMDLVRTAGRGAEGGVWPSFVGSFVCVCIVVFWVVLSEVAVSCGCFYLTRYHTHICWFV